MHILHLSAELAPIAKVGGLGDVLQGLSRELIYLGHKVETILPKHRFIDPERLPGTTCLTHNLAVPFSGRTILNKMWKANIDGQTVYLIDPQGDDGFFQRDQVYGYLDDVERYTYFSKAALEFVQQSELKPDLIHLHEWQTALAAPLYRDVYGGNARLHFTIHNMAHQGQCSPYDLDRAGLHGADYLTPERLQDDETPTLLNLMKGAIVYSDSFNTVSPTYAEEILSGVHHHGIEETVRHYQKKFCGILNGIDTTYWNPADDRYILHHYTADTFETKQLNKRALQEDLGLDVGDRPLVAAITRLAMQKGIPLIRRALVRTLDAGGQFAIIGSPATERIAEEFTAIAERYKDNPNLVIDLGHNEPGAHRLFAAADIVIAPSLFEPCGLIQLVGMRYGTVPVVRKTGGLADTVFDIDYSDRQGNERNGFVFEHADSTGIDSALDRALATYRDQPDRWREVAERGMRQDVSWKGPAQEYLKIYGLR